MKKYFLIGLGGMLGAILRHLAGEAGPGTWPFDFPVNTFLINMAGCFILALIFTLAFEIWELDPAVRLGIATGFLGALTTFSTLCRETTILINTGLYLEAGVYVVGSAVMGLVSVWMGSVAAKALIFKQTERRCADD